jgi:hypothetical protein
VQWKFVLQWFQGLSVVRRGRKRISVVDELDPNSQHFSSHFCQKILPILNFYLIMNKENINARVG